MATPTVLWREAGKFPARAPEREWKEPGTTTLSQKIAEERDVLPLWERKFRSDRQRIHIKPYFGKLITRRFGHTRLINDPKAGKLSLSTKE